MEAIMTRTVRHATGITGFAGAALLVATPASAVTNRPAREEPDQSRTVIQLVEVPPAVPVDDTANEVAQMAIAAALGAAIAAAARRRRSRHRPARTGTSIIDITETVRL
jgi:MYXO-CTERM domain-containing protein